MTGGTMIALLAVLILFGVTARLTRLVTADTIALRLRAAFINAVVRVRGRSSKAIEFIECPWCAGLYIAFAVTLAAWGAERLWLDDPLLPLPGWLWVPGLALTNNYLAARWQT